MAGKNADYWKGRFEQLEQSAHRTAQETFDAIERDYRAASREIERDMAAWYQRFSDNNGVSYAEAKRLLSAGELKEFKWTVQEYIRHGKENGISADWSKQLENASARFHITRLQALQLEVQNTVEVLYDNQLDALDRMAKQTYLDHYLHTAFEVQNGVGVGWDIAGVDTNALSRIIKTPWTTDGKNFSTRIWDNKQTLIAELQKQLTQNLMLGKSPSDSIAEIAKKMNTSEHNAARLIFTESSYFQALSQEDCFNSLGVQKFQFIATLDERTSEICQQMDGQVFDMKDFQPGVNANPMHPWCRSCTAPYYADLAGIGERAARDPETGQTYYVPREMTYPEWKNTFTEGGSKDGLTPVVSSPVRVYNSVIATRLGQSHYDAMRDLLDNAPTDMQEAWDKYENGIGVADLNEAKRQHCDWNAGIHINLATDSVGTTYEKPYQVIFHESGHALDMIAGRDKAGASACHPSNLYSASYKGGLFPKTIKDEVNALVSARDVVMKAEWKAHDSDYDWLHQHGYIGTWEYDFYKKYGSWVGGVPKYSKSMAYNAVEKEIRALSPFAKFDLSDIMEGATKGKISAGSGHGNSYWKHGDWTLATEAFAEMVDSTVTNQESLDAIKKYIPKSYQVFLDMLHDMK